MLLDRAKTVLGAMLPPGPRRALGSLGLKIELLVVRRFFSYSPEQLRAGIENGGVRRGDTVCMHSSFALLGGFTGNPGDVINCVLDVIGRDGTLVMMSMPYTGFARDYLAQGSPFDVKRTVSRMGIITEVFRRRRGVVRSVNPVHPVLALGRHAAWIVEGHDSLRRSCGAASPFEKLFDLDAKILFFDAPFRSCTFLHHLEDRFQQSLPVRVYDEKPMDATVVDAEGAIRRITTLVFDPSTARKRDEIWSVLEADLRARRILVTRRIGNSRIVVVGTRTLVDGAARMFERAEG